MANRFALEGANVLLAAKMSKNFQQTIHENIQVIGDVIEKDDIHLILEYKRNEHWGNLKSPRANRFIIHSDRNNPTLSSVEKFEDPLKNYDPNLLVVGGLQMMDNYPFAEGQRRQRLRWIEFMPVPQYFDQFTVSEIQQKWQKFILKNHSIC